MIAGLGEPTGSGSLGRSFLRGCRERLDRWADAEALRRVALGRRRKTEKPDSFLLARDLAGLGSNLLKQETWSEAEPLLRECLAIREQRSPTSGSDSIQ
jgi:serine/threonine-protein kinase